MKSQIQHGIGATLVALVCMTSFAARLNAQGKAPTPEFLVTRPSAYGFEETLTRVKQAIEAENLMVIHEINPQQMLRMVGMRTKGMRQILFFHPRFMRQIIEANRNGGIEPPLKILVMEAPNGKVMVRYENPVHQFAPYQGLDSIASELSGIVERVVGSVTG
ncbi:MAG: DUF302 domain-containing protein [Gemmatimonadales bacterium]